MLIQLSDPSSLQQHRRGGAPCHFSEPHCGAWRVTGGADVRVGLRSTVRLDTDARTDPLPLLTAQVSAAHTASRTLQTDPRLWGLPPGDAYA